MPKELFWGGFRFEPNPHTESEFGVPLSRLWVPYYELDTILTIFTLNNSCCKTQSERNAREFEERLSTRFHQF
jgi:hypothetical protein